jgi:hypothetical protein
MTTFYKKEVSKKGKVTYTPVSEYDSDLLDSFHTGSHLVTVQPGSVSRRYRIDPAFAPMIAAGRYAEQAMSDALFGASQARLTATEITAEQSKAWEALKKTFNDELHYYEYPSMHEVIQAGLTAMEEEAAKLLENPTVKKSYDNFMLLCSITKEN